MSCQILGLGTATPPNEMNQEEALTLFSTIACEEEKHRRLTRALFRNSAVSKRHTVVPHQLAYHWCQTLKPEMAVTGPEEIALDEPGASCEPAWKRLEEGLDEFTRDSQTLRSPVGAASSRGPSTGERMRMYAAFATQLALESTREAFKQAELEPPQVTHLITVTCTGFDAPGVDLQLIQQLGLSPSTQRIQIGFMGCHAAINGLRTAQAITDSDPSAVVLLCCIELCSLHYRSTWDSQGIIGNALFADGAASMLLGGAAVASDFEQWHVLKTGSMVIPDSLSAMSWKIGDHGFEMKLTGEVSDRIEQDLQPWLCDWLAAQRLSLQDIDHWGVHPGGPRVLSAVEQSLNLPTTALAASRSVLEENGNMSSPTVLFILERFRRQSQKRNCQTHAANGDAHDRGSYCLLLGFGPGLVAEIALLNTC